MYIVLDIMIQFDLKLYFPDFGKQKKTFYLSLENKQNLIIKSSENISKAQNNKQELYYITIG